VAFWNKKKNQKISNATRTSGYNDPNHVVDFLSGNDLGNDLDKSVGGQLKLSVVYRCIDLLSNSIGKIPMQVFDTKLKKSADDANSKRLKYLLNVEPNSNMTSFTFLKLCEINRLLTGNAYVRIHYDERGIIDILQPLNSDNVQPQKLLNGNMAYLITDPKTKEIELVNQDEIIHIKGMTFDGFIGTATLQYTKAVAENALLQDQFSWEFYNKGGRPQGILNVKIDASMLPKGDDGKVDKSGQLVKQVVRDEWERVTAGSINRGRVAVLDEGINYQAVPQISQRDMAFIELKELSIADIARYFGLPLYKLNAGKESYQSNEANGIAYVVDTLTPILTQYEQEFTRKCLTYRQKVNGVSVKGNLNAEMRGDIKTRTDSYEKMIRIGVNSINEIRAFEDMPAVEGGDLRLVSKNYASLENFVALENNQLSKKNKQNQKQENTQQGGDN